MRDFPPQVGPGGEPVSDSASWTSSNANDTFQEPQNTITDSGQILIPVANPPDNTQLSQAIARNAAVATFYADSGAANVYVLSTLGSFKAPTVYLDGQIIRWIADNANTTSSTINVNGVGVVDLVAEGGAALSGGEIDTTAENQARHNLSSGKFELVRSSATTARVGLTLGTFTSSSSGTEVLFSGISDKATMIIVSFVGVSPDAGTTGLTVQLGDPGGIETSGYIVTSGTGATDTAQTAGFRFRNPNAAEAMHGSLILTLADPITNQWTGLGSVHDATATQFNRIVGSKALSDTLTQLSINYGGVVNLDAGNVNIMVLERV